MEPLPYQHSPEIADEDAIDQDWIKERDELLREGLRSEDGASLIAVAAEPAFLYGDQRPPYSIIERSRQFALWIISFTRKLREQGWLGLSEQLFDSGTSIGAHMSEAQQAESRRDFLHKTRVAAKEAKEAKYWISLCRDSPHLPYDSGSVEECDELNAILGSIIKRTTANDPKKQGR